MGFSISLNSLILVSALLLTSKVEVGVAYKAFSVLDYGAVGDGHTDDTSAFTKAWNDACKATGGTSTIKVPQGKVYRLKPTDFFGPCQSYINFEVSGVITAPEPDAWKGLDPDSWLAFKGVNGLSINGPGSFDGSGEAWWNLSCKYNSKPGCIKQAPATLRINNCDRVYMRNVSFKNSPQMHLVVSGCSDVTMKYLNVTAPEWSPNTDGIHIGDSHVVSLSNSIIGTGDDCVSISDRTSDIRVTNIKCGPGHGVSIGSLGKGGVEVNVSDIYVDKIDFLKSTNGARIKTWQEGKGQVSRVFFSDLTFDEVENPIIIDQHYCDHVSGGCPRTKTGVKIDDVHYTMAVGTSSTEVAINLNCSENVPCTNIHLESIKLDSATRGEQTISSCNNAFGTTQGCVKPNPW